MSRRSKGKSSRVFPVEQSQPPGNGFGFDPADLDEELYAEAVDPDAVDPNGGYLFVGDDPDSEAVDPNAELPSRRGSDNSGPGSSGYGSGNAYQIHFDISLKAPKALKQSTRALYIKMLHALIPADKFEKLDHFLEALSDAMQDESAMALSKTDVAFAQSVIFFDLWSRRGQAEGFSLEESRALLTWLDCLGFAVTVKGDFINALTLMTPDELATFIGSPTINPIFHKDEPAEDDGLRQRDGHAVFNGMYGRPLPNPVGSVRSPGEEDYVDVDDKPVVREGAEGNVALNDLAGTGSRVRDFHADADQPADAVYDNTTGGMEMYDVDQPHSRRHHDESEYEIVLNPETHQLEKRRKAVPTVAETRLGPTGGAVYDLGGMQPDVDCDEPDERQPVYDMGDSPSDDPLSAHHAEGRPVSDPAALYALASPMTHEYQPPARTHGEGDSALYDLAGTGSRVRGHHADANQLPFEEENYALVTRRTGAVGDQPVVREDAEGNAALYDLAGTGSRVRGHHADADQPPFEEENYALVTRRTGAVGDQPVVREDAEDNGAIYDLAERHTLPVVPPRGEVAVVDAEHTYLAPKARTEKMPPAAPKRTFVPTVNGGEHSYLDPVRTGYEGDPAVYADVSAVDAVLPPATPKRTSVPTANAVHSYLDPVRTGEGDSALYADVPVADAESPLAHEDVTLVDVDLPVAHEEAEPRYRIEFSKSSALTPKQGVQLEALFEQFDKITLSHRNFLQRHPKVMLVGGVTLILTAGAVGAVMGMGKSDASNKPPVTDGSCGEGSDLLRMCALVVRDTSVYVATQVGLTITPANLLAVYESTKNATFLLASGFATFTPAIIEAYRRCNETVLDELCRSPDDIQTLTSLTLDEDIDFYFDGDDHVVPEDGFLSVDEAVSVDVDGGEATQVVISNLVNTAIYREIDGVKTLVTPVDGEVVIPAALLDEYFFGVAEADYFGPASYQVEVDATSDATAEVSLRSDPMARGLIFSPLPDSVTHTGTQSFAGVETDFIQLDTQFQLSASNEQLVARQITGPMGMVVQQQIDGEWQVVASVDDVVTVGANNAIRVRLPQGEHAITLTPCVDYGADELACHLDTATINFTVNYAPPVIDTFTTSSVSWIEGQQRDLVDIVDAMQIAVTKGSISDYLFSSLNQVEFVDTRHDTVLVPVDGVVTVAQADLSHYAIRALNSEFHGQASFAAQLRVAGLDGSSLSSAIETVNVTVDPELGVVNQQGDLSYVGVSDQAIELNNTFTATEAGESVVGRRLTGLTAGMQVESLQDGVWQVVAINNGEALIDAASSVRVMLPPGDHELQLFPCVDYGAAAPSCIQQGVTLGFDVAHPAPVVDYGCPDDVLLVEDGVVNCDDIFAAMDASALHADINTLQISNLHASLRVVDAQGQLVSPDAQGVYVLPVDDLGDYAVTAELNAYGEMTYDVALGITSYNGPASVTASESCVFDVTPTADDVLVTGDRSNSDYHTHPHEFDVNFTVVDGETLLGRELRNVTASMTVERQVGDEQWEAVAVTDGVAELPAEGVFRVTAPEGEHDLNLVPCVDIGDGATRCDYPPTVLTIDSLAVPTPAVLFRDPALVIGEGNKIPLTQFTPTVQNATLTNITIELPEGISLYEGAARLSDRTKTIFPSELSRYSVGMTSIYDYGDDQHLSLQAHVNRLDGQPAILETVDRTFDVRPIAGRVIYNGDISADAFEGQVLNITAPFVLQHPEGETLTNVGLSGVPAGVTLKYQHNGAFVDAILTDGSALLPVPSDGRLVLQLLGLHAEHFDLRLVPHTEYGADAPKTDHDPVDISVTFLPLPVQAYADVRPQVLEGERFALSTLTPTIQNGTLTVLDITLGDEVSLYDNTTLVSDRTKLVPVNDVSRYNVGLTSAFAYGNNQTISLQAHVNRVNGEADVLPAVTKYFDVAPVAGDVIYNGPVTVEKFEGQVLDLVAPFSLAHSEGESFAGVTLSGIANGVTVKQKVDGAFVDVTLTNGGAVLSLPADGRLELQLSSQAVQDFTLRLVPHTNYGADAPKTDHDPVDIAVEFKTVPEPVITFEDPGLAVDEGSQVALSQYAASVEEGVVTGYVLTVNSGTKIFRDGSAIADTSVTVSSEDVSRYSIGTPLSTDYGAKTFTLKPQVETLRGDAVTTSAEQRSVTFNPVAGAVSASGPTSVTVPEDTWKTITRTFTTEAGESVTSFQLGNVPSHMSVQYHDGNGFVDASKSGSIYTIPVSGNQVQFRLRSGTKGNYALTQKAVVDYGAVSTVTKDLAGLSAEVNCVLQDCSLLTCAQARSMRACECEFSIVNPNEDQIINCKYSPRCSSEEFDALSGCSNS